MRLEMFGRLIVWVGWLAWSLYAANGALGFFGSLGTEVQRIHLSGGLGIALLALFVQLWIAFYLLGLQRWSAELDREEVVISCRRGGRIAVGMAVLLVIDFLVAVAALGGDLPGWFHATVTAVVWCSLIWGLMQEGRVLSEVVGRLPVAPPAAR